MLAVRDETKTVPYAVARVLGFCTPFLVASSLLTLHFQRAHGMVESILLALATVGILSLLGLGLRRWLA